MEIGDTAKQKADEFCGQIEQVLQGRKLLPSTKEIIERKFQEAIDAATVQIRSERDGLHAALERYQQILLRYLRDGAMLGDEIADAYQKSAEALLKL